MAPGQDNSGSAGSDKQQQDVGNIPPFPSEGGKGTKEAPTTGSDAKSQGREDVGNIPPFPSEGGKGTKPAPGAGK